MLSLLGEMPRQRQEKRTPHYVLSDVLKAWHEQGDINTTLRTTEFCPVCGEGQLVEHEKESTIVYKGLKTTVVVPGKWCDACDDGILGPDGLRVRDLARAELRAQHQGVLGPREVKRIREKLGLSQRSASELLGGGAQSFQRYESGSVIVSEGMSNQLILLDKVSDLPESLRLGLLDALRVQREALQAQKPQSAA